MLRGQERPEIDDVRERLAALSRSLRVQPPSRATIHNFIPRCRPHRYAIATLPAEVRTALYNLEAAGTVPGPQLVFYAFQYGDLRATCFAAGLPWIDLHLADRMRAAGESAAMVCFAL
jgi:hypothetical protein